MIHENLANIFATEYLKLSDHSAYIRTPLTMHNDGTMIGAYLVDEGPNRIRITDDSQLLYQAMVNGLNPSPNRNKQYGAIAEQCGLKISSDGELFVVCEENQAPYFVARFLEAADRISYISSSHRKRSTGKFEKILSEALEKHFNERIQRRITVRGASGHSLSFPFMLNGQSDTPTIIQPVAATDGKLDWGNVYQAAGKFMDLKNRSDYRGHRIAVLEDGDDSGLRQAKTVLSDTAQVIVFHDKEQFVRILKDAA